MKKLLVSYLYVFAAAYFTTITVHTLFVRTLQSQPGGAGFYGSGIEWTYLQVSPAVCICALVAAILRTAKLQLTKPDQNNIEPNVA